MPTAARYVVRILVGWPITRAASRGSPVPETEARVWDTYYQPWAHVRTFSSYERMRVRGGRMVGAAEAIRRARALARDLNRGTEVA